MANSYRPSITERRNGYFQHPWMIIFTVFSIFLFMGGLWYAPSGLSQQSLILHRLIWGGAIAWGGFMAIYSNIYFTQKVRKLQHNNQALQAELLQYQSIEAQLLDKEERWKLALQANNDGIWDWDIATNQVYFSPQWKAMLGFEEHEVGNSLDEWLLRIHPDDLARVQQETQDHLAQKTSFYVSEYRLLCKDGSYKWILDRGQALKDKNNYIYRMVGSHTDTTERKSAEIALKESEGKYRNLIEHLNIGFVVHGSNTEILQCNETACCLLGLSREQMLGKAAIDPEWCFLKDDGTPMMVEDYPISHVLNTHAPLDNYVVGVRRSDRTCAWVLVSAFPEFDLTQQLAQVIVTFVDITELKQTEEALRQSEATKQAIIHAIPDLLIHMKANGNYVEFISNSHFNIIKPEQIRNHVNLKDILPAHLVDKRLHYTQEALQTQSTQIYEQEVSINGGNCYEEVRIVPLYHDEVLVMVRDITSRKQAEEALHHQKEMLQAIINHIPVMVALFNQQGTVEFINPELVNVLGWSLEEWQQQDIFIQCYPDPDYRQTVLEHMLAATGQWKDLTTLTASGQSIETSWANVLLSDGKFLGIGQDISDRKQKETELQKAMEAAESANVAKSMFLANMSHELRTPLNIILGFTQLMSHDSSLSAAQQQDLKTIQRSGDHLLSLINDVLDLSKIEAGHSSLEENSFDLISLLHTLCTMIEERTQAKHIHLSVEIDADIPQFVIADEQKLRQVLLNLLSNAVKFTDQGTVTLRVVPRNDKNHESNASKLSSDSSGTLTVDHSTVPLSSIQNSSNLSHQDHPEKVMLIFEVSDTGVGIDPKEMSTIFNAFIQADAGRRSMTGTGLGLTISCKLLELMGGDISVHSQLGEGSTFTVTVPVQPTNGINQYSNESDRRVLGLAPGQNHYRILVVDDQNENRQLIVRILTRLGLEVREAENGIEAIRSWQDWQPHLIWMDIRMPKLDGYEATKQIRALENNQNSIIIALTAQASQSDRTLALAAGCNDYVSKPVQEEALLGKLTEYLQLHFIYADISQQNMFSVLPDYLLSAPDAYSSNVLDIHTTIQPLLESLPAEWCKELVEEAMCCDDHAIMYRVKGLPTEMDSIATYLADLAHRFQFEQIIELFKTRAEE